MKLSLLEKCLRRFLLVEIALISIVQFKRSTPKRPMARSSEPSWTTRTLGSIPNAHILGERIETVHE
jgi:hypothetical protein